MACPICASSELMIRQPTGIEKLRLLFTAKRKYRCRECGFVFRAPDRRKVPRETTGRTAAPGQFKSLS